MERICGIICELNPLHEGHRYIISKAKEIGDAVVLIMSGNFVQRGECAIRDKYERARDALDAGADAVLELPFPWSSAPAEFFARAGVTVAAAAGVTDLVFGSECGNAAIVMEASRLEDDAEFSELCKSLYTGDVGYAEAREAAAKRISPRASCVFTSSNDMLAAEYMRQAEKLSRTFDFHAVRRIDCPSATELRRSLVTAGEFDRAAKLDEIERILFRLGKYRHDSFDHESGIVNRLAKASASSSASFIEDAATKKYTYARLRRAALFSVTGVTKSDLEALPDLTLVLGANGVGREIIKGIDGIEAVTKPSHAISSEYRAEAYADRLYTLCKKTPSDADEFLKKSPVIY